MRDELIEAEGGSNAEIAPYEPDKGREVNRTSRRVTFNIEAEVVIEVVEPPMIPNANVRASIHRGIIYALTNIGTGIPAEMSVKVRTGKRGKDGRPTD